MSLPLSPNGLQTSLTRFVYILDTYRISEGMIMKFLRFIATSFLASAIVAGSALAAPPTVQLREVGAVNGLAINLQLPVNLSAPGNYFSGSQTIAIGSDANTFLAYCVDPFQYASTSFTSYNNNVPDLSTHFPASAAAISTLYNYAYAGTVGPSTATTNQNAAAFQLALWEIANDNGNLATGLVHTTGTTTLAVVTAAQSLLTYVGSNTSGPAQYSFRLYTSADRQDYLVAIPVPEPETYAMFLAGLGLMAVIARRRKAS